MKKIIFFVVLLLIPFQIEAASIKDTSITGTNEAKVGEELSLSFGINFSGIQKGSYGTPGIWLVTYELIFDDSVVSVTEISSKEWNSVVTKSDGKYYVISEAGKEDPFKNKCSDNFLNCTDYLVTIHFVVKATDKTSTTIRMGEVEAGLFNVKNPGEEYTEEELIEISGVSNKSQTVSIKQGTVTKEPESIVTTKTPSSSIPKNNTSEVNQNFESKEPEKENNNYLKSITIENYDISFKKEKKNYYIDAKENSLNVSVMLEDEKATYQIIGADDLEKNDNKVTIEVTSESGEKNIYTIYTKLDSENLVYENKEKEEKKNFSFKLIYLTPLVAIFFILIVINIVKKIKDKKIDKSLDEL